MTVLLCTDSIENVLFIKISDLLINLNIQEFNTVNDVFP